MYQLLEKVKNLAKQIIPAFVIAYIIRLVLSLPPKYAQTLSYLLAAPTISQRKWIKTVDHGTWRGAWIGPNMSQCNSESEFLQKIKKADLIIYKVHGGAFRVGHCTMYMDIFIHWLESLKERYNINALILSIEYGLAPEYKYPTPMIECTEAYKYLVYDLKVPGSKIILSGDSAGATLCLGALIRVYAPDIFNDIHACRTNYDVDMPAGILLASPLLSLNVHEWLWHFKNDLVSPELAKTVVNEFLDLKNNSGESLSFLRLLGIKSHFSRFVPNHVMLIVGNQEVMRDDILSLAKTVMRENEIRIQIHRENFQHDWYFLREIVESSQYHIVKKTDDAFFNFVIRSLASAKKKKKAKKLDHSSILQVSSCVDSEKKNMANVPISAIA